MFTTMITIGAYSLGNHYAVAQNVDKKAAIAETIANAGEIFKDEFLAAKKPYKITIVYPSGERRVLTVNK